MQMNPAQGYIIVHSLAHSIVVSLELVLVSSASDVGETGAFWDIFLKMNFGSVFFLK